jgi:hypothetical protein
VLKHFISDKALLDTAQGIGKSLENGFQSGNHLGKPEAKPGERRPLRWRGVDSTPGSAPDRQRFRGLISNGPERSWGTAVSFEDLAESPSLSGFRLLS